MYAQLLFNTFVSGLLLAQMAVGFNLIFNTTKVFHLAHGALYVAGAYAFIQLLECVHFGVTFALLGSLLIVTLLAVIIEKIVYQPLASKKSGQAITLISSIGVYLFLTNLIALSFGNETKFIDSQIGSNSYILGVTIIPIQLVQLVTTISLIGGVVIFSQTKWFLKVKATASNETVASVLGVNTKVTRLWMIVIGSALAGITGILQLYDTGIDPLEGMSLTLSAAVAVIIGGQGAIKGTIFAALIIALLQTTTEWFISAQWKEGLTFLLLIVIILWRTEGIVSFKMRVEET